jgi:single-strand DNA-binding protein
MSETRPPLLNKVFIVGNLTRDPELRQTTNGTPVVNFRIAANRRFKDNSGEVKEEVCYIGVVAWQKLAMSCADHLIKGSAVYIEGELRSRTIDSGNGSPRNIIEIRASHIQFLDKKRPVEEEADYLANGEIIPYEDLADQEEF